MHFERSASRLPRSSHACSSHACLNSYQVYDARRRESKLLPAWRHQRRQVSDRVFQPDFAHPRAPIALGATTPTTGFGLPSPEVLKALAWRTSGRRASDPPGATTSASTFTYLAKNWTALPHPEGPELLDTLLPATKVIGTGRNQRTKRRLTARDDQRSMTLAPKGLRRGRHPEAPYGHELRQLLPHAVAIGAALVGVQRQGPVLPRPAAPPRGGPATLWSRRRPHAPTRRWRARARRRHTLKRNSTTSPSAIT